MSFESDTQIRLKGMEVLDRALNPVGDDHRTGCSADLPVRHDRVVEVIDHDLGLLADRMVMGFDILAQLLLRPFGIEPWIILDRLH